MLTLTIALGALTLTLGAVGWVVRVLTDEVRAVRATLAQALGAQAGAQPEMSVDEVGVHPAAEDLWMRRRER